MKTLKLSTALLLVLLSSSFATAADWRQFRGSLMNGIAEDSTLPISWNVKSGKNIAWKAELPGRGLSSPIVVGNQVIVTASSGFSQNRLHVLAFDTTTGKLNWKRQFWATGRTQCHIKTCVAAPTPASDGKLVFATFSSNDVVCLDLKGNLKWFRGLTYDFPNASNSLGMSSSLVVSGKTLVVQVECDAVAFTMGLNTANGISRWKIDRPRGANWTSPTLFPKQKNASQNKSKELVLLQSSKGLTAVVPATGKIIWDYGDGASTIPSSVVGNGIVFIPSKGITAVKPIAASDAPKVLWNKGRLSPATSSPFFYRHKIYTVNRAGVINCANATTGDILWRLRLKGPFGATPVAANGKIYYVNEHGLVQIVKPGDKKG
ncbi:hypothetical protein MNBD_PLANCTO02-18, partial [hydrothermal vent metagenome]